jgi:hypothetical protein
MTKIARLLCALWVCGPLVVEAGAAEAPAGNDASAVLVDSGHDAADSTPGRDANIKAGRPVAQGPTEARSGEVGGSTGRHATVPVPPRRDSVTPTHAAGPLARSNADRLHSLSNAKAHARVAKAPNRMESAKVAAGNLASRGIRGSSSGSPTPPALNRAVRGGSSLTTVAKGSTIGGGSYARGYGRLPGPTIGQIAGRTARNASLDGTQLHHKF